MISGRGLGHTGGTLDKFDSIPGYTTQPDNATVPPGGRRGRLRHHRPDRRPRPGRQAALRDPRRDRRRSSRSPLITASILSKKLAAGLDALILDVKTGSGAFMPTLDDARALAESLVEVANGAGLTTRALITDMNEPLATAAGNALEVPNAVDFLHGDEHRRRGSRGDPRALRRAAALTGLADDAGAGAARIARRLDSGTATETFRRWSPRSAGRRISSSDSTAHLPRAPIVRDVRAGRDRHRRGDRHARARHGGRRARRRPPPRRRHDRPCRRLRPPRRPRRRRSSPTRRSPASTPPTPPGSPPPRRASSPPTRIGDAAAARSPRSILGADRLMPRAILCILDSVGIGGAPDAARLRRRGANTLGHIAAACAAARADRGPLRAARASRTWTRSASAPRTALARRSRSRASAETPARRLGRRPRGLARARTRRPATGRSPACRCPSPGAISRRPTRPSRPTLTEPLIKRAQAARHPRQQARLRHAGHRGVRRGAHPDRQADLLHLRRLRVPDRRARDAFRARAALRGLRDRRRARRTR